MSNPFIMPRSPLAEQERKRRERFRVGVYALLGAAAAFFAGMLIQGCQRQQKPEDASAGYPAALSTNAETPSAPTEQAPATNAPAPAATQPAVTATPEPLPLPTQPVTNAAPLPPPPAANERTEAQPPTTTPAPTASPAAKSVYTVKRGDTLTRIAKTHGITVQAIKAANNLKTDRIVVGQHLKLPQAGSSNTTAVQR